MLLRQKSRTTLPLVLSLLCVALIAAGAWFFCKSGAPGEVRARFLVEELDPAAVTGTLPGAPRKESSPGEGMFGYRLNAAPTFEADGSGGKIQVQNPAFNDYLMVLELADETGAVVYRSGFIAPNQYIEKIDLQLPLTSGEHPATAFLNAVDPDTLQLIDALECPLTITVK